MKKIGNFTIFTLADKSIEGSELWNAMVEKSDIAITNNRDTSGSSWIVLSKINNWIGDGKGHLTVIEYRSRVGMEWFEQAIKILEKEGYTVGLMRGEK